MQAFNIRIHKLYSRPIDFKKSFQVHRFYDLDNILFAISGIVIFVWTVGFFGMDLKFGIHILLIFAANLILLGIIQHSESEKRVY